MNSAVRGTPAARRARLPRAYAAGAWNACSGISPTSHRAAQAALEAYGIRNGNGLANRQQVAGATTLDEAAFKPEAGGR